MFGLAGESPAQRMLLVPRAEAKNKGSQSICGAYILVAGNLVWVSMPSTRAWDPLEAEAPTRLFISVEFASTAAAGDHNVEVLGLEVLGTRFEVSDCKFEGL